MHQHLEDLIERVRQTGLAAAEGFPDGKAGPVETTTAAVTLEKLTVRPAGLGGEDGRLCDLLFGVAVADRTAGGCVRAVSRLTPLLPGLTVTGDGPAFDRVLRAYVLSCRLPQTVWLTPGEAEEDPPLVFDWKGEITHECPA